MSGRLASYKFLIIGQLVVILGAFTWCYTSSVVGLGAIALGIITVLYHFYLEVLKECLSVFGGLGT